ncbi:DNA-binding protein [Actinotalea fermentans ATCC 43279 = JCM 9966 = DSM 3133]|nr:DNA-binding protein [Actinotalea fermentans ATCC 43279 = JCM 9966 = DSM 3133]
MKTGLRAMLASRAELEASEERAHAELQGCSSVARLRSRTRSEVFGVLRSVTMRPRQRVPALEAELYDGTGSIQVVWLGQRRIAGVEPGRRVRLSGFVCQRDGRLTMYNPRYELAPRHEVHA